MRSAQVPERSTCANSGVLASMAASGSRSGSRKWMARLRWFMLVPQTSIHRRLDLPDLACAGNEMNAGADTHGELAVRHRSAPTVMTFRGEIIRLRVQRQPVQ